MFSKLVMTLPVMPTVGSVSVDIKLYIVGSLEGLEAVMLVCTVCTMIGAG